MLLLCCCNRLAGNYFNSTMSALAYNPSWVTTYGYAQSTGIDKALAAAKDPYTLFVPTNKAWKPIEPDLMVANTAAIGDILKYHVTPGARQVWCHQAAAAAVAAAGACSVLFQLLHGGCAVRFTVVTACCSCAVHCMLVPAQRGTLMAGMLAEQLCTLYPFSHSTCHSSE
jgi:hypothetical protein